MEHATEVNSTYALEKRLTHKYVGEYQHLDDWQRLGTFTVVAQGTTDTDYEDICQPQTTTIFGRVSDVPRGTPRADIEKALRDTFTSEGCAHEWDCCGCRSYRVNSVTRLRDGHWKIIVGSSRNY